MPIRSRLWKVLFAAGVTSFLSLLVLSQAAIAQMGFAGCRPANERKGETGCWIIGSERLAEMPKAPMYWSLDTFPNRSAAESAKGRHGQVYEALGKTWVFTIAGRDERPATGQHVTQIGPLPIREHGAYMAQYMEAILEPGMESAVHRHPGLEAFYTEAGESCLETPSGKRVGRKGVDVIVAEGEPMVLTASGEQTRRSIVLVLHDASQPWMSRADDWKPVGLCGKRAAQF